MGVRGLNYFAWVLGLTGLYACGSSLASVTEPEQTIYDLNSVVWAVNVGGGAFRSADGIHYIADATHSGEAGHLDRVEGAQEEQVYRSYRLGQLQLKQPLANGDYDITFHFVEPLGAAPGDRVFDVFIQGEKRIESLDISRSRNSSEPSALSRTVPGVVVDDGVLHIELVSGQSTPVLSGILVRQRRPSSATWELIWADEFDYEGRPDPARWSVELWEPHKVNREAQAYTDHRRNLRVEGGSLILEAHRAEEDGAGYTSARIHSRGKGDFLYGRVDIRARLPAGQGTWAALWMLPTDPFHYASKCSSEDEWHGNGDCDAWPNSGEIDIMEHVGYEMNIVHGTVHNRSFYGGGPRQVNGSIEARRVDERFHVYSLEWSAERIDIFVDGTCHYSYLNEGRGWEAWPFDQPFHVILNLAIGGHWGEAGGPIDDTIFPTAMEVDYVRVFRAVRPDAGEGSAG